MPDLALRSIVLGLAPLVVLVVSTAAPAQGFLDVTAQTGIFLPPEISVTTGRGAACGDFDGDGDLDLVIPRGAGSPIRYFRNEGGLVFSDLSASSGLGLSSSVTACVAADPDNDGDLDLYVCRAGLPNCYYVNDGLGVFQDLASPSGVDHAGAAYGASFADYDRDGWLDLYVCNRLSASMAEVNVLYRNNGDGTFSDVTATAGVGNPGASYSAAWLDYDEDGWLDLFIANDKGVFFSPNALYHNNGDGTFSDVSVALGMADAMDGMGVDFVDAFNDGSTDVFITNSPTTHVFRVWSPGVGQFQDLAPTLGLAGGPGLLGWGTRFLDYDNDGWQDLLVVHIQAPNHLHRNPGAPPSQGVSWPDHASVVGLDHAWSQYVALVADFDDDGRLDILDVFSWEYPAAPNSVRLQLNQATAGNWLRVRTRGTVSNRDGIGARIAVTKGSQTQTQMVRSGVGFLTGSDLRCHFGLGTAVLVDRVDILWPSGQVQTFVGVSANQEIVAEEPRLGVQGSALVGTVDTLELSIPGDGGLPYIMTLAASTAPGLTLADGRVIPIALDSLALLLLSPGNPILPGSSGVLAASGTATSPLVIPLVPGLSGLSVHGTAITSDPAFPSQVKTIIDPAATITFQ